LPSTAPASSSATCSHCTNVLLASLLAGREQLGPQPQPGPVQPDLRGRLADTQLGGNCIMWQVVHIAEYDDGPQARGERLEGGGDPAAQQRSLGVLFGVAAGPGVSHLEVVDVL